MGYRYSGFLGLALFHLLLMVVPNVSSAQNVICREKSSVPEGYVITSVVQKPSCVTGYGATIELPVDNLMVCAHSPIPKPFVVTGGTDGYDTTTCRGVGRLSIRAVSDNMMVCSNSPIPPGYGVTYFTSERQSCLIGRKLLNRLQDGMSICSLMTSIPSPYVVTWVGTGLNCGNSHQTYRINTIRDGMSVCSQSTIHPDYVITLAMQGGACGAGKTYTINQAHDGIYVCDNSPIPPSYVVTWRGVYASCGQLKSYRLNVVSNGMEACSGKPVPSGYVITNITSNASDCLLTDRYKLEVPYEGMVACANSPIPAGWKKDGTVSIYYCSRFQGIRLSKS